MTASATCTSIFYRFTSLPCELRDQIWQAALPERGGPVLYFFKKGGWYPERPAPSDINYDPEDNTNLSFKYRHEVLDPVEIELPIFFVNREAREIALAWIHTHNIKIRVYRKDGQLQAPVFVSNFDPAHDAMYVSLEKWMEFLCESVDRGLELDMIDRFICTYPPDIKRIALPEALFRRESHVGSSLAYLMGEDYGKLRFLYIVVDTPLDLQPMNDGMNMQPRWELKNIEAGGFYWSHEHGLFYPFGSLNGIDEALYKLIVGLNEWLGKELVKYDSWSFEVRPAFAIRA